MDEREREETYWEICMLFFFASPFMLFCLVKSKIVFEFNPLCVMVFAISMFSSIPMPILTEIILNKLKGIKSEPQFWLVRPSVESHHRTNQKMEIYMQSVKERLSLLGFSVSISDDTAETKHILFEKAQTPPVNAFLDHAIWGEIDFTPYSLGADSEIRLTFGDILILETGELREMRALSDYIILKTPDYHYENVPFTLFCGVNLAFATVIISFISYLNPYAGSVLLLPVAAGAVGMILVSFCLMLKDPKHLFGYRLGFAGLYFALLPYLYLLYSSMN